MESEELSKYRYKCYKSVSDSINEAFDTLTSDINSDTLFQLTQFIFNEKNQFNETLQNNNNSINSNNGQIKTGVIVVGNGKEQDKIIKEFSEVTIKKHCYCVTIDSKQCTTLSSSIEFIVYNFLINDTNGNYIKKGTCADGLHLLVTWYNRLPLNKKKLLVILFKDIEHFNSEIIQDLITILNDTIFKLNGIRILFLMTVSTSDQVLLNLFSQSVLSMLILHKFHLQSSPSYSIPILFNYLFNNSIIPFIISPITLTSIINTSTTTSLFKSLQLFQLLILHFYYNNPFSFLCNLSNYSLCDFNHLLKILSTSSSNYWQLQLLNLPSYSNNKDNNDITDYRLFICNEFYLLKHYLENEIKLFRIYLLIVQFNNNNTIINNNNNEDNSEDTDDGDEGKEYFKFRVMEIDKIHQMIKTKINHLNSSTEIVSLLCKLLEQLNNNNNNNQEETDNNIKWDIEINRIKEIKEEIEKIKTEETTITNNINNNTITDNYESNNNNMSNNTNKNKWGAMKKRKEILIKGTKSNKEYNENETNKKLVINYICDLMNRNNELKMKSKLYDAFCSEEISNLFEHNFNPNFRKMIANDLEKPKTIISNVTKEDKNTIEIPDISLTYATYKGSGNLINLYDWFQSFSVSIPPLNVSINKNNKMKMTQ